MRHYGTSVDQDYIYHECPDDESAPEPVGPPRNCKICGKQLARLNTTDTCFHHPVRFDDKGNLETADKPDNKLIEKPKNKKRGKKFNGAACKNCGGTLRYASNHNCVACERERIKRLGRKK